MPEQESAQILTAKLERELRAFKAFHPGEEVQMGKVANTTFRWPLLWANLINYIGQAFLIAATVLLKFVLDDWLIGNTHS